MKKVLMIALVCLFMIVVYGGPRSFAGNENFENTHSFEVGPEIYHFAYSEPETMDQDGYMYGGYLRYIWRRPTQEALIVNMVAIEGRGSYGLVDYTSNNSGTVPDEVNFCYESRLLFGKDYYPESFSNMMITPFVGVGYRYLNNDSSGSNSSTGALGYERESKYVYSPIGVAVKLKDSGSWSVSFTGEYDLFWWGEQISHLSDVSIAYSDVKNYQKNGYGVRAAVQIKSEGQKANIIIEPFMRYWSIKKSDTGDLRYNNSVIGVAWEPKNNTTEIGGKIALQF